ncbi:HNH endonuclease [Shewanella atlantica]|uniref:HNH endonuclease n=1 Tax=Shewanella atlantica TaxID=271099 RepID=A0A3S0KBP4_9GAMM|nr:hypothetical protein [Shewanella atlantica]RTR27024.1 hypothetical protein EKG39_21165 [Shewanella atlantica]
MRTLTKPTLVPKTVYLTCISRVRNPQLRTDLESVTDTIEADALDYENHSQSTDWHLINESVDVDNTISKDEMEKVYNNRMANIKAPGRAYYDELKGSSPFSICPLCGHRTVEQLDHYLPQSKFPSLVVLPINLVPSCEKCNKIKLNKTPKNAEEQTLHPYYDDVTGHQWLFAEVNEPSPTLFFFVKDVALFDDELNKRINYHFKTLGLNALYGSQTGAYIAGIRYRLSDLHSKGGLDAVKEYLLEEEVSRRKDHINSWQRAMFQALTDSDWFCDGGFNA